MEISQVHDIKMADYAVKVTIFLETSWRDERLLNSSLPMIFDKSDLWCGWKRLIEPQIKQKWALVSVERLKHPYNNSLIIQISPNLQQISKLFTKIVIMAISYLISPYIH